MNFTTLRYAILLLNFEIYIVHFINHEWNRYIFVAFAVYFCMRYKTRFTNNWYQNQVFISCLYIMWFDFRIKEKWFLDDIRFTPRMHILLVCSKWPKTIRLNRLHSLPSMLLACIECNCYITVTCMHRLDINVYVGIICWLL